MNLARGFTLIEMSIVLVIIGLIAGGILTGQSLIHAAQLRSQIKQIQDYQLAFNTFIGKYDCVPGDCANATTFFGNATVNGDGNGIIDTFSKLCYDNSPPCGNDFWNVSTEMSGAFQQLSLAHLIDFAPSQPTSYQIGLSHPPIKLNTSAGFFLGASYNFGGYGGNSPNMTSYQTGTNMMFFVHCANTGTGEIGDWDNSCAIFTASDLQAIDQKIDDGMPLSGKLLGFGGFSTTPYACLNISGVASTYNISNLTAQCQAAYVLN